MKKKVNYLNHPYPDDFYSLINEAKNIAEIVKQKALTAPVIDTLYRRSKKNRVIRIKDFFQNLGQKPTRIHGAKSPNEIKGIYFFIEDSPSFNLAYVGISATILRRMKHHTYGSDDNQPSLAYLIASHKKGKANSRKEFKHMEFGKQIVRKFKIVIYPIEDDYQMYFFEVALSGILNSTYNSFKTH